MIVLPHQRRMSDASQQVFGVTPDLATFGKSMGNGAPISALVGKRRYMKLAEEIFYSTTSRPGR